MVYQQFLNIVDAYGDKVAINVGDCCVTYAQLNARAEQLAAALVARGVTSTSAVATIIPNGAEFFVATLATFRLGATLVPLNVNYTDSELIQYIDKSSALVVVGDAQSQQSRIESLGLVATFVDTDTEQSVVVPPVAECDDNQPALIMFSSGSTGGSKQVMRTYRALLSEWKSEVETFEITPDDTILCTVPLHHTHGFGNVLLAGILSGAKIVVTPGEFNPRSVIKALDNHQVTIYPSATFMVKMLSVMRLRQQPDLSHLKIVYTAGAPLEEDIIASFSSTFGVTPRQLYGSTETGAAAVNKLNAPSNSVGQPMANVEILIVDEQDNALPQGEEGEIVVISDASAKLYVGMPEQTAKTFRKGRYYTGDLGRFDENGNLYVTGRRKKMINVAGLKVDPAEVESVILAMEGIAEVVVLGKKDGDYGEKVKAVIVPLEAATERDVIEHCKAHLAEYKWPKIIEFRNDIPKSPLRKILRKYL